MSAPDMKAEIIAALSGTTAQHPMDTHAIITKTRRQRGRVEAALGELYQVRSVYCCKITDKEGERVVWWVSGNVPSQTEFYGKRAFTIDMKKAEAAGFGAKPSKPAKATKVVRRMSQFSRDVIDTIKATPGLSMPELKEKLAGKGVTDSGITSTASNLVYMGYLRTEGEMRRYRYYQGTKA
jgi:hypothetical protein